MGATKDDLLDEVADETSCAGAGIGAGAGAVLETGGEEGVGWTGECDALVNEWNGLT